ncbi:MAG: right-handed parallel beta-helix repeat-containing protein [Clostridia bacterium]|nr:right-handed parallel beta-helix repeat-containing protein [Clostridia bacterium]
MEGTYSPVTLSNDSDVNITLSSYNGENARIMGATALSLKDAKAVTDSKILGRLSDTNAQSKLYCIDISHLKDSLPGLSLPGAYNLKSAFAKYGSRFGVTYPYITTTCEVFFENDIMTNARYPNDGYLNTNTFAVNYIGAIPRNWEDDYKNKDVYVPDEVDENGKYLRDITDGFKLGYNDERADNWTNAPDALMFGYWGNGWATQTVPVKSIDVQNNVLTSLHPSNYGVSDSMRFYIYNLLEEIDTEGEYYIDRENYKLYFYRSAEMTDDKNIYISLSDSPLVKINKSKNITVKDITLTASRGNGIAVNNSSNINILNCSILNTANNAVSMDYVTDCTIDGCTIKDVNGGIIVSHAGDVKTLTEGRNVISNNTISRFARINKTYKYAANVNGVGNKIIHNKISDTEHTAIGFGGCNNEISYNDISNVCQEVNDASAIYVGRSWINRGNIIKHNYIHDIYPDEAVAESSPCSGIYFDDHYADGNVYGNIFVNISGYGVKLHGGREINVENNIFVNCSKNSAYFNNYGANYSYYLEEAGGDEEVAMANYAVKFLNQENSLNNALSTYDDAVWSERFPEFWSMAKTNPTEFRKQSYNTYLNNIELNSELFVHRYYYDKQDLTTEDAYSATSEDFVDYEGGNFNLTDAAKAKFTEFIPVDFLAIKK